MNKDRSFFSTMNRSEYKAAIEEIACIVERVLNVAAHQSSVRDVLRGYSYEFMDRFYDSAMREGINPAVARSIYNVHSEDGLSDLIEFGDHVPLDELPDDAPSDVQRTLIGMLYSYPMFAPYGILSSAPEAIRDQCKGVLRVMSSVYGGSLMSSCFLSYPNGFTEEQRRADAILQHVLETPSDGAQIAAVIRDRQTLDYEIIRSVLQTPATALGVGVL